MYEQAQIILDGELLGNNVIVNRLFESIYNISPLIIKNFINIINKTTSIPKPVRIKKYYFTQNNCINIVFKNKIALGEVQFAYILNKNNELQLDEYKILIIEGENKGHFIAEQNLNTILKEDELKYKLNKTFNYETDNIKIQNNCQEDSEDGLFELNQINDEKGKVASRTLEEILNGTIDVSFSDDLELNNKFEKKEEIQPFLNENEKEVFTEDFDSEEDEFEAKKEIYNRNLDRKKDEFIDIKNKNIQEEISVQTIENTDILERIGEKTIIEKVYTQNVEVVEQVAEDLSKEEFAEQNAENIVISEKIKDDSLVENLDLDEKVFFDENIEAFYKQESVEFANSKEIELEDFINIDKIENSNTVSDLVENNDFNDISDVFEENNYNKHMDLNVKDFDFIDKYLNDDDLIDFFDVFPRFIDDDIETDKNDYVASIDVSLEDKVKEENIQNTDKNFQENKEDKDDKKLNELNRNEKIAMYQKILKGYDNGMTENKLNKFKENFNIIQNKEDEMTSDDVLDAQVKLLLDNSSKAFRILETEGKQDVIQIGEELFLSKDKIYTWGDVYYLE